MAIPLARTPELAVDLHFRIAESDEGRVAAPERALADDRVQDRLNVLGHILDQQRQPVLNALDHLCESHMCQHKPQQRKSSQALTEMHNSASCC